MNANTIAVTGLGSLVSRIVRCTIRLSTANHPNTIREIEAELALLEAELNRREATRCR